MATDSASLATLLPPGPWAEDALIRESGFVISERPPHGPAIWVRLGRSHTHAQALAIAAREQREKRDRIAAGLEPEPKRKR